MITDYATADRQRWLRELQAAEPTPVWQSIVLLLAFVAVGIDF